MIKKKIGLLFGSFNPIHIGHLVIADTVAHNGIVDEVWFVVSPQNPFKEKKSLLNQYDRLHLVNLAIEGNDKLKSSSIEFKLSLPSYTIDTLTHLKEEHAGYEFSLIMGEDNLVHFHKWKNYEQILDYYSLIVYPRRDYDSTKYEGHPKITRLEVPLVDVSATYIRSAVKENQAIRYLLPDGVFRYITKMNLYKK